MDVLAPNPVLTTDAGASTFVAGDNTASTPVTVDSGITLADGGATTAASATVTITGGFQSGQDVLGFVNDGSTMGNIAESSYSDGVLTLTSTDGSATIAQWQAALRTVTYTDTAGTPAPGSRVVSFQLVDANDNDTSVATRAVTVAETDQTPIVTTSGSTATYTAGATPATIDAGETVSDLDNATQASATVAITAGFVNGDVLAFDNTGASTFGNIVGTYDRSTGVLTLTSAGATATLAQWAHALSAVSFAAPPTTTAGTRTISFQSNDGTESSTAATDSVNVVIPPTPPPTPTTPSTTQAPVSTTPAPVSTTPTPLTATTSVKPATAGLTYHFSAHLPGAISYRWTLNGHRIGSASTITYTFPAAGRAYKIHVTVTTASGRTAIKTITFTPHARSESTVATVHFQLDHAALNAADRKTLARLRTVFDHATSVTIDGYCAAREADASHSLQQLSGDRAASVLHFMLAEHSPRPKHLSSTGLGANDFVATNGTAAGRASNRRATITIHYLKPIA